MKRLKAAKRLRHPADVKLFLQILATLLLLPGRIRRMSLPELLAEIDSGVSPVRGDEAFMLRTVKITDLLLRFRLLLRYGKCFLRSLTLFKFLRRQGWPVEIHFGVRKTGEADGSITGHSWLVLDGERFMEPEGEEIYTTTYSFPSTGDDDDVVPDLEQYHGAA